ncbi:MAG: sulfotransferase [Pseudomonadota bacterium]
MADHIAAIAAINKIAESGETLRARATAEALLQKLNKSSPSHAVMSRHYALLLLTYFADADGARRVIERQLRRNRKDADALAVLARIETVAGRKKEAAQTARRLMALNPREPIAYQTIIGLDPEEGARLAPNIEALLADARTSELSRKVLLGELGRIRDRQGDHAGAYDAFLAANAIGDPGYDPDIADRMLAEARAVFTPEFFATRRGHGLDDARMVFIIGMPRSGTTLLEQLLASHRDVSGLGESEAIKRINRYVHQRAANAGRLPSASLAYAHLAFLSECDSKELAQNYLDVAIAGGDRPEGSVWVDKMPGNYVHLGLIRLLFPNATVIWADRDPRDVALSCFQANFESGHGYARRPERMAHMLPVYLETRRFWRELLGEQVTPVAYEDLVREPGAALRSIAGGLGLDWRDDLLAEQGRGGSVQTASVFQAREAIHTRSIGRWRNYAEPFAPAIEALEAYERLRPAEAA